MTYSERDICTKFITPAILKAGWSSELQLREEVTFTKGKILLKGKLYARGKQKRADYILYFKPNIPIAIVEAKDDSHTVNAGIQQALDYAAILDIPFAYSSNGKGFYEHDKSLSNGVIEREITLDEFPSPTELWKRYKRLKGISEGSAEHSVVQDYYDDPSGREARYYQVVAINRTIEAISKSQNRILLVMATGTGKTYVAFQIIWRLWKAGIKKRILFLADRNVLLDQTKRNDFKHFKDKLTIVKKRKIDKSYEIYLALYQGLSGNEDWKDIYKEFSPDFFDLVIVDECHRGSAAIDSAWREILQYFNSATQIGLTATPKETRDVSNTEYFGDPIYTYSLKQGIEDGFLAPYKVVRINIDKDLGWRPEEGETDRDGIEIEDREYNAIDYDRHLVLTKRRQLVAQRITELLKATDRFAKTIVFCVDIEHATFMRDELARCNSDLMKENHHYVMKITGDDEEGKRELDNFIDPEQKYPVIATTSKLMTTGVDAQTCKVIVLDSNIQSMTEFKQIIGRGTRIREDFGKVFFTILDFRNVTRLFADPDFDGIPEKVYEPKSGDPMVPEEENFPDPLPGETTIVDPLPPGIPGLPRPRRQKIYVDGVEASIINERIQYIGADGKLITESLKDFSKKNLRKQFHSMDDFIIKWNKAEKKLEIIDECYKQGVLIHELQQIVNPELDIFDLICHVAFDNSPLTRKERANNVKKRNYFVKYGEQARAILEALLEKYADKGIESMESNKVLKLDPLSDYGTPREIVGYFGGTQHYNKAVRELENEIYKSA